jgi:excisionase family DNA binding protein
MEAKEENRNIVCTQPFNHKGVKMHTQFQPPDPEYPSTELVTAGRLAAEHRTWLTAAEAAQYLHVKARTILLWVRQGKVKAYTLTGTQRRVWRFLHADLEAMVTQKKPVVLSGQPSVLANERSI